jgi:hypothetical protein
LKSILCTPFWGPNFPPYEGQLRDLREAARALDVQVIETFAV